MAGILPSALVQRGWWRWPVGILVGQVLVTIPLALRSPFGPLGWLYMTVDMVYCLAGIGVGTLCEVVVRRLLSRQAGDAAEPAAAVEALARAAEPQVVGGFVFGESLRKLLRSDSLITR